jgi:Flp pilus assembly pilin Flp
MLTGRRIRAQAGAFIRDRKGGTAIEYALVAAILGTALVTSFQPLAEGFVATFEWIAAAI